MIIGFLGVPGAGKDTAADEIIRLRPQYKKIKLADKLKDTVSCLFNWDRQALEGITDKDREWREKIDPEFKKVFGLEWTPRKALQTIGTNLFRNNVSKTFWTDIVKYKILKDSLDYVVISDCRFPDEMQMILDLGGILVYIHKNLPWTVTAINFGQNYNKRGIIAKIKTKYYRWILEHKYHIFESEFMWATMLPKCTARLDFNKDVNIFKKQVREFIHDQEFIGVDCGELD